MERQVKTVQVGLGDRSYPIHIGSALLEHIGRDLRRRSLGNRYGIISDDRVADLYGELLLQSLADAGVPGQLFTFPHGESSKNLQTIGRLASELARHGFDRQDSLIGLGGGVAGDMAGFLASIYMRGIPFVQVPTSLLAQVDSSVGGKTGVDIPEGKNLVGTFYQPRVVYIDMKVLDTLPPRELLGGLAEVVKYGVIRDEEFFSFLETHVAAILERQPEVMVELIARCCQIKAWVVEQDERESGLRRILNFGHTLGHAIEAASEFRIIHGLAVSLGMVAAMALAVQSGCCSPQDAHRLVRLLQQFSMPVTVPPELERDRIKAFLKTDKKTVGGRVFFVLPETIGRVRITDAVREEDIDTVLGSDYSLD